MVSNPALPLLAIVATVLCVGLGSATASPPQASERELHVFEEDIREAATREMRQATRTDNPAPAKHENPLTFQTDLAIWTAVVFVLLMGVLWYFAWGPIRDGLDRREEGIAYDLEQAKEARRRSEELLREYERKLADSADEVRMAMERAKREAEDVRRQIIEEARERAAAERERGVREIEAARRDALKELAQRSADMAVLLAGKVIATELRPSDHARLLDEAVESFLAAAEASDDSAWPGGLTINPENR